jgi:integrase
MLKTPPQKVGILPRKRDPITNGKLVPLDQPLLDRGMNLEECMTVCNSPIIPIREKVYFRLIYETLLRPMEVRHLLIENWDKNQRLITAQKVKVKTKPQRGDKSHKEYLPTRPRTAIVTENTNEMLRAIVGNRKKGYIFVNEKGFQLTASWFKEQIHHYAKILGIQKNVKPYNEKNKNPDKVHYRHLVTCMALREAGERHHDSQGGSRKLSAFGAGHSMAVKEKHYEKADFEEVQESMKKFHPAFVQGW